MKNLIKSLAIISMLSFGTLNAQYNPILLKINQEDGNISLKWTTTKEVNSSSYFVIESSTDGKNFAPLAQVKAAGYSLNNKSYTYQSEAHAAFYRISLVAMDGGRSNSLAMQLNSGNQDVPLANK